MQRDGVCWLRHHDVVFRSPVAATRKNQKKTGLPVAIFTFGNKKTDKNRKKLVSTSCNSYNIDLVNTHILSLF